MENDRRRSENERRRSSRVPATFSVKKSVGPQVHLCLAEDIGPGGMTIKRPKDTPYRPRTPVSLQFELPDTKEEIAARGVIVYDSTAGRYRRTGVRFIAVRPEHQQAIAAYVRRSTKR